jgi:hypothetical protein
MPRPSKAQQLVRAARDGQPVQRVEVPRAACARCGQDGIPALPDGSPRPHLRPTRPGEALHSELVPTMTGCGATIEVPGDIQHVIQYLTERDMLIDTGTPEAPLRAYQEWRAAHGQQDRTRNGG